MKAILILDEKPITCWDCPCHDCEFDVCQVYKEGMTYDSDNCPLKPMPQKNKYDVEKYATVDYENDVNLGHYLNKGWNDCIDEILGENE